MQWWGEIQTEQLCHPPKVHDCLGLAELQRDWRLAFPALAPSLQHPPPGACLPLQGPLVFHHTHCLLHLQALPCLCSLCQGLTSASPGPILHSRPSLCKTLDLIWVPPNIKNKSTKMVHVFLCTVCSSPGLLPRRNRIQNQRQFISFSLVYTHVLIRSGLSHLDCDCCQCRRMSCRQVCLELAGKERKTWFLNSILLVLSYHSHAQAWMRGLYCPTEAPFQSQDCLESWAGDTIKKLNSNQRLINVLSSYPSFYGKVHI